MLLSTYILTILSSSNPLALITSRPELLLSKLYASNAPVFPQQQYPSDIHLQSDWYLSDCGLPDHLPLCTIQQPSLISCTTVCILLAVADDIQESLHVEVKTAGFILFLCP